MGNTGFDTEATKGKPPIWLLLFFILAEILVIVFGGLYAVPRVFSLESFIGPPLGIVLGFVVFGAAIALAQAILKTIQRCFDY